MLLSLLHNSDPRISPFSPCYFFILPRVGETRLLPQLRADAIEDERQRRQPDGQHAVHERSLFCRSRKKEKKGGGGGQDNRSDQALVKTSPSPLKKKVKLTQSFPLERFPTTVVSKNKQSKPVKKRTYPGDDMIV
jgi:hypothetical protein